jgi:hypothetical protein
MASCTFATRSGITTRWTAVVAADAATAMGGPLAASSACPRRLATDLGSGAAQTEHPERVPLSAGDAPRLSCRTDGAPGARALVGWRRTSVQAPRRRSTRSACPRRLATVFGSGAAQTEHPERVPSSAGDEPRFRCRADGAPGARALVGWRRTSVWRRAGGAPGTRCGIPPPCAPSLSPLRCRLSLRAPRPPRCAAPPPARGAVMTAANVRPAWSAWPAGCGACHVAAAR